MRILAVQSAAIFVVAVFVHFLWEMQQSFAYEMSGLALEQVVLNHLWASLGDGVLTLLPYCAVALARRDACWIGRWRWTDLAWVAGLGLALSLAIEWRALATGRWSYTAAMPIVPILQVGLLPVLQLILLPAPIYWAAHRLARGASSGGPGRR